MNKMRRETAVLRAGEFVSRQRTRAVNAEPWGRLSSRSVC